ncbi:MAG: hypothetical protein KA375_16985 [Vitreoscilla sp.]|nr:hypothetical protein [Vitreoscilla sp.]
MTSTADFAKMVPGFDFLQGLVKNAGSALPNIGQWVAPTLNPEELEKKIEELRTVQFWLEQNARMLGATIQAMEVQRMTLSTLKSMNVSMGELRDSMTLKVPEAQPEPEPKANPFAAPPAPAKPAASPAAKKAAPKAAAAAAVPGVVDPMQWWGALTKQFTELAAGAMKDTASDAAKNLATTMMKQSFDAAGETLKKAVAMPAAVAQKAASAAGAAVNAASKSARSAKAASAKPAVKAAAKRAPAKAVRRKPY